MAEAQEQMVQHLANRPAPQQKASKQNSSRPRSQQGRSSYSQDDPGATRTVALQAQQKAAELTQQLGAETQVTILDVRVTPTLTWTHQLRSSMEAAQSLHRLEHASSMVVMAADHVPYALDA